MIELILAYRIVVNILDMIAYIVCRVEYIFILSL
jgi:hypothetical protein